MEIKINSLALHNFKGVRGDRVFRFDGQNARIEGDNGTGKSTVFDAFTWLLFGKDHQGRDWTNFNIKPIDPATRETIHGLDGHWVEAVLLINGVRKTLRRVVTEDWVKPRGETERILKGHTQQFFIDGVDTATKKNYDQAIAQWIDEGVFRIVTNPLFFIDDRFTSWQDRRHMLLQAVGYNPDAVAADFKDLVAEMNGAPLEQFRKQVAAAKKAQKDEIEKANANINAWNAALPEAQDTSGIKAELKRLEASCEADVAALRKGIADEDATIADITAAGKALRDEIATKNGQILRLKNQMADYTAQAVSAENESNAARSRRISELKAKYDTADVEHTALLARRKSLQNRRQEYVTAHDDEAARLKELGRQYQAERDAAFTENVEAVCPTCGRPYPEEEVAAKGEQLRAAWLEAKKKRMLEIQERVPAIREELAAWDKSIEKVDADLKTAEAYILAKVQDLAELDAAIRAAEAEPLAAVEEAESRARMTPEYLGMASQADTLEKEIAALGAKISSPSGAIAERQRLADAVELRKERLAAEVRTLLDALAVEKERSRIQDMITAEEARRATLSDELARLERLEARTLEYIKASVDACEEAINARFKVARWKMFDRTLDGGIVEMCEVTTLDGVPYRSMNDAMRIRCGMDVIRMLSEAGNVSAPIFIDNAESVTTTDFGLPAQIIRLVVKEGAPLTVIPE